MGNCKDCKYWSKESLCLGVCSYLYADYGNGSSKLLPRTVDSVIELRTFYDFGCVHFEQKPKGPFRIVEVRDGYPGNLYIACGSHKSPTGFFHKDVIEMFVDWLNDLWEQKECECGDGDCNYWEHA